MLSGGPSLEAAASRLSAAAVVAALKSEGHEVLWLDHDEGGDWRRKESSSEKPHGKSSGGRCSLLDRLSLALVEAGTEVVFPVIHGAYGEDGQIQRLCRKLSLPCVGCDETASARCYDKACFKRVLTAAGLPVAPFLAISSSEIHSGWTSFADTVEERFGFPCIVKPSRSGSSIGLSRVESREDLEAARDQALEFDRTLLAEKQVRGTDVEVGVYEDPSTVVGTPIELEIVGSLYDFEAKYFRGDRRYIPPRCSERLIENLRVVAASAFDVSGCSGMARVDFLVDPVTENFVVNEINTIPYMPGSSTFTSSICDRTNQSYPELMSSLVRLAVQTKLRQDR